MLSSRMNGANSKEKRFRFVFLDAEMTGLDLEKDELLELATVVTTPDLDIIAEGPELTIRHDEAVYENMNSWCKKHHNRSGLIDRCRSSGVTVQEAEDATLEFLKRHVDPGRATLCGNSVYVDRMFLGRHMPRLAKYFHHRIVDVSTLDEIARRCCGRAAAPGAARAGRAGGTRRSTGCGRRRGASTAPCSTSTSPSTARAPPLAPGPRHIRRAELRYYRACLFRPLGGPAERTDAAAGPDGAAGCSDAAAGPDGLEAAVPALDASPRTTGVR